MTSVETKSANRIHQIHGWCAGFCGDAVSGEHPTNGRTVEDHGPWCYGHVYSTYGLDADGAHKAVYIHPVSRYMHGQYTDGEHLLWRGPGRSGLTAIFLDGDSDTPDLLLDAGMTRQLAAELMYVADVLAGLDRPHPRRERGV
jgi:hypothetical protein